MYSLSIPHIKGILFLEFLFIRYKFHLYDICHVVEILYQYIVSTYSFDSIYTWFLFIHDFYLSSIYLHYKWTKKSKKSLNMQHMGLDMHTEVITSRVSISPAYNWPNRCCIRCWIFHVQRVRMGWLWLVGSIKLQVSFAKEPYKRDDILQKRLIILSMLLTVATPYGTLCRAFSDALACVCNVSRSYISRSYLTV